MKWIHFPSLFQLSTFPKMTCCCGYSGNVSVQSHTMCIQLSKVIIIILKTWNIQFTDNSFTEHKSCIISGYCVQNYFHEEVSHNSIRSTQDWVRWSTVVKAVCFTFLPMYELTLMCGGGVDGGDHGSRQRLKIYKCETIAYLRRRQDNFPSCLW